MFCYSTDETHFNGKFETREDALIEARSQDSMNCRIHIGEVSPLDFKELASKAISRIDVTEMMRDIIEEEIGEDMNCEPAADSVRKLEDATMEMLAALMEETWGGCFGVENITQH